MRLKDFIKNRTAVSLIPNSFLILAAFLMVFHVWAQQIFDVSDAPGELSPAHQDSPGLKNCSKCHNEDLEVEPSRCLACHKEIAARIAEARGYHRDKGEDCAVCHAEHQGMDVPLVPLDPEDFDHEETGVVLEGVHLEIKDCRRCHREDNTLPRKKTHSYLFRKSGCTVCHSTPHPGHQEKCLSCHSQNSWEVDILHAGGIR
jgi:hypothetical protein